VLNVAIGARRRLEETDKRAPKLARPWRARSEWFRARERRSRQSHWAERIDRDRLTSANVSAVAVDLGVSERHLRRVFRETVGVSPKAFAKLKRFHRALRVAREDGRASWASIAAAAGYYDQAHLIAEVRAIAGATPRALLGELRAAPSSG
jgi:AraC-like DNA-binding protein